MEKFITVRPVKPFAGSYVCGLSEADTIDDQLVEDEQTGQIVKRKVPRKRFFGEVATERRLTPEEFALYQAGKLPGNLEVVDTEAMIVKVLPKEPVIKLPEALGQSIISRGLAERVNDEALRSSPLSLQPTFS